MARGEAEQRRRAELAALIEGLAALGVLPRCRAVLSGYLGSEENGGTVLDALEQVRAAASAALYCCDPVMGDRDSGLYVAETLVRLFRDRAVPSADIVAPNHFELELLTGRLLPGLDDVAAAARELRERGPRVILVSSLVGAAQGADRIGTLAASNAGDWLVTTPLLSLAARGAGDPARGAVPGSLAGWRRCRRRARAGGRLDLCRCPEDLGRAGKAGAASGRGAGRPP